MNESAQGERLMAGSTLDRNPSGSVETLIIITQRRFWFDRVLLRIVLPGVYRTRIFRAFHPAFWHKYVLVHTARPPYK